MNEFQLIQHYFANPARVLGSADERVKVGIGDDCAVLAWNDEHDVVITTDSMIEGVHFLPRQSPRLLGARLLAVNASDVAAMGGATQWVLLSLSLPRGKKKWRESWIEAFSAGFYEAANAQGITVVGGNTTQVAANGEFSWG
jgi:thiamine-monophosphate kinase